MRAIYKFADIYFSNEVLIIFMLTMITCFKFTFAHTHTHMYMCIQIYIYTPDQSGDSRCLALRELISEAQIKR